MKFLKYLAFFVLATVGLYLILCGAGPKNMNVSQTITVQASPETVFDLVSDFNKWSQWSPWAKKDPNAKYAFTGEPMTMGHAMSWEGNEEVGSGTQKIVELKQDELVKSELKFKDFGDDANYASFIIKPDGEGSKVTWNMESSEMPFMMRGMAKLMNFQASLEKDYVAGLAAIKEISEKAPKAAKAVDFEVIDITDMHYLGKRFPSIKEADVNAALFETTYGALGKAIGGMDKMAGMPFSIGHSFDYTTHIMDLEIALPIAAEMKAPEGMSYGKVPAGKAAKFVFYGPYEGTGPAWQSFMEAVTKKYKPRFPGYEVYANDPTTVKSPSEIITWLIAPIE